MIKSGLESFKWWLGWLVDAASSMIAEFGISLAEMRGDMNRLSTGWTLVNIFLSIGVMLWDLVITTAWNLAMIVAMLVFFGVRVARAIRRGFLRLLEMDDGR